VDQHVAPAKTKAARFIGHVVLAAVLGPYAMSVAFGLLESNVISEYRPEFVFVKYPLQIFVFGFPVIFLFAVLSFFPLLAVLRISNPRSKRTAFLAVGASLGLLVGGCLAVLVPGLANAMFLVMAGILVGLGCGVFDWLIWKPRNKMHV